MGERRLLVSMLCAGNVQLHPGHLLIVNVTGRLQLVHFRINKSALQLGQPGQLSITTAKHFQHSRFSAGHSSSSSDQAPSGSVLGSDKFATASRAPASSQFWSPPAISARGTCLPGTTSFRALVGSAAASSRFCASARACRRYLRAAAATAASASCLAFNLAPFFAVLHKAAATCCDGGILPLHTTPSSRNASTRPGPGREIAGPHWIIGSRYPQNCQTRRRPLLPARHGLPRSRGLGRGQRKHGANNARHRRPCAQGRLIGRAGSVWPEQKVRLCRARCRLSRRRWRTRVW